ncbi:hypothetical protein GIY30_17015 [Gordonia sp. HNM0687]|uniref:Uncharacterized protein n=1 Tax=Gordonia mangrovi TaxID=2665643 RepID=A0A6L7GVH2_9ACTN|nr:hypothetical protein [Gordonia mangrovi]MXP23041.1 hypothetical protein [Gordonia mangrovi]UVF77330.1 hypothetical protein NWF22_18830 [Gordonia mangrovi]
MGECADVQAIHAMWREAVEQGGIGHTAGAFAILEEVARSGRRFGAPALESLALSTRASLLRQAGRHRDAAAIDGRALLVVSPTPPSSTAARRVTHRAAVLDAIVGLAADHLGQLHLDATRRLLARARSVVDVDDAGWPAGRRPRLRIEWVSAELAMYSDDAAAALEHAERGLHLCAIADTPRRHRVKTELVAAAAHAAAGQSQVAARAAAKVTDDARAGGLLPLEWAALALRHGLDPADHDVSAALLRARRLLTGHGVPFTDGRTAGG